MPADWRVRTSDHGPVLERIPGVVVDCDIASWPVEVDGSKNDVCYGGFLSYEWEEGYESGVIEMCLVVSARQVSRMT